MNETPVRYDATTPRVDRRAFLKLGVAGGAGALVAACGWDGGNAIRPNLLAVSRLNDWVGEKILFSPTRLARTYSPAERSRSLPSYFISATTPMLKDPRLWRLRVDGLVDRPLELSIEDLMRMPRVTARYIEFVSFDAGYSNGWDWASALHPQTILAYGMNDNPIPAAHGAPLRLYSPIKFGYKLTKYLVSMTFTDRRPGGYWEDQGYPWFAGL